MEPQGAKTGMPLETSRVGKEKEKIRVSGLPNVREPQQISRTDVASEGDVALQEKVRLTMPEGWHWCSWKIECLPGKDIQSNGAYSNRGAR